MKSRNDRLQGTVDLLVLTILDRFGPLHGYAIAKQIRQRSLETLWIEDGSLYPAIHRMEQEKWIKAEWGLTDSKRPARLYKLTALGKKQLQKEEVKWAELIIAVNRVVGPA